MRVTSEHNGHRERLRGRFLAHGLDGLYDHEVLELLLCYSNPRMDMNPVAHKLLDRFGSLSAVLDAPMEELTEITGVGEYGAVLMNLFSALYRRYELDKVRSLSILDSVERAGRYVVPLFRGCGGERVYLITMDICGRVICRHDLGDGGIHSVGLSPRRVVELALLDKAAAVLLAHNHISGYAVPSVDDEETTIKLQNILAGVDIVLWDHFIVANGDFVSMRENGTIGREEEENAKL